MCLQKVKSTRVNGSNRSKRFYNKDGGPNSSLIKQLLYSKLHDSSFHSDEFLSPHSSLQMSCLIWTHPLCNLTLYILLVPSSLCTLTLAFILPSSKMNLFPHTSPLSHLCTISPSCHSNVISKVTFFNRSSFITLSKAFPIIVIHYDSLLYFSILYSIVHRIDFLTEAPDNFLIFCFFFNRETIY
jgi:hypothetical protein